MSGIMAAQILASVALFTRAWIEIPPPNFATHICSVALFTRAWIEIKSVYNAPNGDFIVALFTRAWIEITLYRML